MIKSPSKLFFSTPWTPFTVTWCSGSRGGGNCCKPPRPPFFFACIASWSTNCLGTTASTPVGTHLLSTSENFKGNVISIYSTIGPQHCTLHSLLFQHKILVLVLHFDYVLQLFFLCNKKFKLVRPELGRTKKRSYWWSAMSMDQLHNRTNKSSNLNNIWYWKKFVILTDPVWWHLQRNGVEWRLWRGWRATFLLLLLLRSWRWRGLWMVWSYYCPKTFCSEVVVDPWSLPAILSSRLLPSRTHPCNAC